MKNGKKREVSIENLMNSIKTKNINEVEEESLSFGERLSDMMADFAGSWTFIIIFMSILFVWIALNSVEFFFRSFDPFPFILLNLILSCIAALQAPVIMMSQNRQEKKDRIRAEHDYEINLKAEYLIEEILLRLDRIEKNQNK